MENLKEGDGDTYVDLKEIERTSGGGVKTSHMRMILEALANFHGAWMVWMRKGGDIGDMTRSQMMKFFGHHHKIFKGKWLWKSFIKKTMSYYIVLADTKNMQSTKERIQAFIDSPQSVGRIMMSFLYKNSKFKTMTHSDLWTSQIMFSLYEDGKFDYLIYWQFKIIAHILNILTHTHITGTPKRVKILDYQALTWGHPARDIWSIVYSCTDAQYRKDHMEEDLRAYFAVLSGYMDIEVDYTEFRQELEDRRPFGMVQYGIFPIMTLSPKKLPNPLTDSQKFGRACKEILRAEETEKDHPDLKEIRRRMMSNLKEMEDINLI